MVLAMKRQFTHTHTGTKQRTRGFADGFVTGMASLLTIAGTTQATSRRGQDPANSLRGDFSRIGNDMRVALEKERAREKTRR
jgi:hypothetical protein